MQKLMESIVTHSKITEICNKSIFSLFQNGFGVKMFFRGICFDLYFTAFVNERNLGGTFW